MSGTPTAIMLFAAGFGTRMGELTRNVPKPLIRVAGRTLIDHALDLTGSLNFHRKVVNLHYKADVLSDFLSDHDVMTSVEAPDILDTGGGLKAALPLLREDPVFTMNTDAIWSGPNPLELLAKNWKPDIMDALLVCVPVHSSIGRKDGGDFEVTEDGRILRGEKLVYGGVQIIKCDRVRDNKKVVFSLNEIWDEIAARNRLFGTVYPGKWCDVGHPEGIELAEKLLSESHV